MTPMSAAIVLTSTLTEVWFHTGTACNLECPFCLEGSRPGDSRLERLTLADVRPIVDEARTLGVRQFSFTGGEPLIVKDIVRILGYALAVAPCLVLTNGTAPLIRRVQQLDALRSQPNVLSFRVSLDHPEAERHDAGRGWGNFRRALEGLALLHQRGFPVSITRQVTPGEDAAAIHAAFRTAFSKHGLPTDLAIVALPDYGLPGASGGKPPVVDDELARRHSNAFGMPLMCTQSKMIVKRDGAARVYACALVDDDRDFEQGTTLAQALTRETLLRHSRCHACIATGASMSALQ